MKVVSEEKENTEIPTISHEKLGGGKHLSLENGGGEKEAGRWVVKFMAEKARQS